VSGDALPLRRVLNVRLGRIVPNRNGIRTYEFALVVLDCGHALPYPKLRGLTARAPRRVRCPFHEAGS
jgi:hypothetical protein